MPSSIFLENALINQFNNAMDGFMDRKPNLQSLVLEVDDSGVLIRQLYSNSTLIFVRYKKHHNGCVVKTEDDQKVVEGIDFISKAFEDLNSSLEANNDSIPEFGLLLEHNYFNRFVTYPVHDEAVKALSNILRSKDIFIKVESFHMHAEKLEHILQVVPFIHPLFLKKVSLVNIGECLEKLEIQELMKLHQWEQVKEMESVNWVVDTSIRNLVHLDKGKFQVQKICGEDVVFMKEILQQSQKNFLFIFNEFENFDHLSSTFGPPLVSAEQEVLRQMWFFKVTNNNDTILNLNITSNTVKFCYVNSSELIFLHNPDNICPALNCVRS